MSEEALPIAEQRRGAKSKGDGERYTQVNAELQRTARRDKNAFFNEQCKEIEENKRKGKTKDLFKKTEKIKGTFHPKTDTVKDRNGMDLTEAEDKARRDGKNIQRNSTKKDLNDRDNHDGVITHSEPDILEREIKWALGSSDAMKDSEGDGISAELFKILKDDAIKVLCSICRQIWKTQQWPQDWKSSIFILISKKGSTKE